MCYTPGFGDLERFPFLPQSLLKTADQLKIKGLCEVPENRDGPPPVSLSSPPRESGTPRLNYTKLKKHHQRYKRPRIERPTFEQRATDPRHYDRYKEEEANNDYSRDNKEVTLPRSERDTAEFFNPRLLRNDTQL